MKNPLHDSKCLCDGCVPLKSRPPKVADLIVDGHGTIYLLRPNTPLGHEWVDDHIAADAMTFGGAIAVEHRYIQDIIVGATRDGLRVE